eukprot:TRINITY_DN10869_c0_g1_i1.p1 TRINITY_DN10869_c0_g1~~TRINITY_DN10869_c0_g1_i1.p1  ORF type:complete len:1082 (+),score=156.19 TRINITY_DN10869_c0_g1_i1:454-3246(+)
MAACCVGQVPKNRWPKPAVMELLVEPLFAAHGHTMTKDTFSTIATSEVPVWSLLRRFARGATDQHFMLTPWSLVQRQHGGVPASEDPQTVALRPPSKSPWRQPQLKPPHMLRRPTMPKSPRPQVAVKGKQRLASAANAAPRGTQGPGESGSPSVQGTHSKQTQLQTSDDADLPQPAGYFQAVRSPKETALVEELREVQRARQRLDEGDKVIDLEIREETLRAELETFSADGVLRWEYRQRLQHLRCGVKQNGLRRIHAGRFWTMSREHAIRGGELPNGVTEPLSPAEVHKRVQGSIEQSQKKEDRHQETKDQWLCRRLSSISNRPHGHLHHQEVSMLRAAIRPVSSEAARTDVEGDNPWTGGTEQRGRLESVFAADVDGFEDSFGNDDRGVLLPQQPTESQISALPQAGDRRTHRASHPTYPSMRCSDVLLAFELYRTQFWEGDTRPIGDKSSGRGSGNVERAPALTRRDEEIDAILCKQERVEPRGPAWASDASPGMTLREFFQCLWPRYTPIEFKTMLKWIDASRSKVKDEEKVMLTPARQVETVRYMVELFDAMDTTRSGLVELDVLERLLSGEYVTKVEKRKLEAWVACRDAPRAAAYSSTTYEWYVDHIQHPQWARFLWHRVQDRPDWAIVVTLPGAGTSGDVIGASVASRKASEGSSAIRVERLLPRHNSGIGVANTNSCGSGALSTSRRPRRTIVAPQVRVPPSQSPVAAHDASRFSSNHSAAPSQGGVGCTGASSKSARIAAVRGVMLANACVSGLQQQQQQQQLSLHRQQPADAKGASMGRAASLNARMVNLARFLDDECGVCSGTGGRGQEEDDDEDASAILHKGLEMASCPRHGFDEWRETPQDGLVRLPRLYWRYLLGCAIVHELSDAEGPCYFDLRPDGRLDLLSFIHLMARDEMMSVFSRSNSPPTVELLRARFSC